MSIFFLKQWFRVKNSLLNNYINTSKIFWIKIITKKIFENSRKAKINKTKKNYLSNFLILFIILLTDKLF